MFVLSFLGVGLILVRPCAGAAFEFERTGNLNTGRVYHTATLLQNGQVLGKESTPPLVESREIVCDRIPRRPIFDKDVKSRPGFQDLPTKFCAGEARRRSRPTSWIC
jgi:hypothetical protein